MQGQFRRALGLTGMVFVLGLLVPGGVRASAPATPNPAQNSAESQGRYLAGVRQAVSDFQRGVDQEPTDPLMAAGYRQGMARARQWQEAHHTDLARPTGQEVPGPAGPTNPAPATGEAPGNQEQSDQPGPEPLREPTGAQADFLKLVGPAAVAVAAKFDLYPSVMLAQAILESNWGQSDLSRVHHNLFGIKGAFQSQSVTLPTTEHLNGKDQGLMASFRAYPDVSASLADYAAVLAQPCYSGVHRSRAASWHAAVRALSGTYATDPDYAGKLSRLIEGYQLDRFDRQASPALVANHPAGGHVTLPAAHRGTKWSGQHGAATPNHWQWSLPVASGAGMVGLADLGRRLLR